VAFNRRFPRGGCGHLRASVPRRKAAEIKGCARPPRLLIMPLASAGAKPWG
jgi:hypothetical protein